MRLLSRRPEKLRRRLVVIAALIFAAIAVVRVSVHVAVRDRICTDIAALPQRDVAMVLGTKALPNWTPSPRLASRCDKAIELYKAGKVKRLLMSGDGRVVSNDEPETMRRYAIAHGVPEKDILTDDLGLRTYDSMVRAKRIFGLKQMVVVTQGFHVDRSLLYCRAVGIDALGVPADRPAELRDRIREPLACISALADIYLRHR